MIDRKGIWVSEALARKFEALAGAPRRFAFRFPDGTLIQPRRNPQRGFLHFDKIARDAKQP